MHLDLYYTCACFKEYDLTNESLTVEKLSKVPTRSFFSLFFRSALFQVKSRVSLKYFVTDCMSNL